jgi:hypothetical protein
LRCLLVETRRKPGNPRLEIFLLLCHRRPRHPPTASILRPR